MAKRITRSMADEAAKQLAIIAFDKKIKEAQEKENEFGDYIVQTYIPAPIQGVMKEYRAWFPCMSQTVKCVDASGRNRHVLYIKTNILLDTYLNAVSLTFDKYQKANMLSKHVRDLIEKQKTYQTDVSNALIQLQTEKRIKEAFPEALPYLNFSDSVALVPQFEKLRAML